VFGNSNSLPISLVISLSQTLKGLHWDKIPGDNDDEVAARGILYLLIFQQLGQVLRWSWGYHVLLAPAEKYDDTADDAAIIEEGQYRDVPDLIPGLDGDDDDDDDDDEYLRRNNYSSSAISFESGGRTPITNAQIAPSYSSDDDFPGKSSGIIQTQVDGNLLPNNSHDNIVSFPRIRTVIPADEQEIPSGIIGVIRRINMKVKQIVSYGSEKTSRLSQKVFYAFPPSFQQFLAKIWSLLTHFFKGVWAFMNPPLWAMLFAVIIASIPDLQRLFFEEGSFIANSATSAIAQTGGVAVPLILVVLGSNLARNTLPKSSTDANSEENQIGKNLLIASLISRMLLPTLIMAPILALAAKYVPVSILDDPIFVVVCFLLTGAPSALQLAQICQLNGVYEGVMSNLLFQSYVIWYVLPQLFEYTL
jgi:predicted permease